MKRTTQAFPHPLSFILHPCLYCWLLAITFLPTSVALSSPLRGGIGSQRDVSSFGLSHAQRTCERNSPDASGWPGILSEGRLAAGLPDGSFTARLHFRWSRQAQQDKAGFYYQPAGLCEDYPREARTEQKLRTDFEVLRQTGAKLLRFGISWLDVEPQPGRYDWSFWDKLVNMAGRYHITLIPYVCYTPKWAAQQIADFWRQPPKDMHLFGDFMYTIARRYKGKIHSWELWNEPDSPAFWLGTAGQFAQMVIEGARGVRQADPNAVVVLGGLAFGPGRFFQTLKSEYNIENDVDVINMHGYAETWSPDRVERYTDQIGDMADLIRRPQHSPDLWMAEFGYSDYRYSNSQVSRGGVEAVYGYEHTPDYQAVELFKAHVLALATGDLSLTAWYRINDLKPQTTVIGDANNRHLGILDLQRRPKPAFYALRFYNRLFDRPTRCIDSQVQVDKPAGSQSVVHLFEKRDGNIILTGWLRSSRLGEVNDASGLAQDTRKETVTIRLPGHKIANPMVYNVQGCPVASQVICKDGALSNIALTGDQVFIAELKHL